jgi:hypothetical protein
MHVMAVGAKPAEEKTFGSRLSVSSSAAECYHVVSNRIHVDPIAEKSWLR